MDDDTRAHYDRLASTYDENWAYGQEFLTWMSDCLGEHMRLSDGELSDGGGLRIADVGCGTGLYATPLLETASFVACIDPSAKMLEQVPDDQRLAKVEASAEEVASGQATLPEGRFDAVFVKEAIHHVADQKLVIRGLKELLVPGGRLVVAMLPTSIDYPLFQAARDRFQELQPDPENVARTMRAVGMTADVTYREFPLSFPTQQYLRMVRNRYMSLLSSFTDEELAAGVEEIRRRHPGETVEFVDRFAFVTGTAS